MPRRKKKDDASLNLFPEIVPGRITIFDLETTGLDVMEGARAVEICAITLDNGIETSRIDTLLDPGFPIPYDAAKIHGITNEMVKGFPSLDDVLPDFLNLARGGALAAYNVAFDISFIYDSSVRKNLPLTNPLIDLIMVARQLFPGLSSYQLWNVRNMLKLDKDGLHRALADVLVCLPLWMRWVEGINGQNHAEAVEKAKQLTRRLIHPDRKILEALKSCVSAHISMEILYEGAQGSLWRKVTPQKICTENGTLVLKGFCHLRKADRTFAVYKISEIRQIEG